MTSPKKFRLKDKVNQISREIKTVEAFAAGSPKQQFIDTYGIELQMPANYIYDAVFLESDVNYVITVSCQILPDNIQFFDYNKLGTGEDPKDNNYFDDEQDLSQCLNFKVYQFEGDRYHLKSNRICHLHYQHKISFSPDRTKLAIYRLQRSKETKNIFQSSSDYVIDIFDCSSIDFFLRDEPLTFEDPSLLYTIDDPLIKGTTKYENTFLKFSLEGAYLLITHSRKSILLYDLSDNERLITIASINENIPSSYECILDIDIDEDYLTESIIALKKQDFKSVEFIQLGMVQELNETTNQYSSLKANKISSDIQQIKDKYPISSIRLQEFDIKTSFVKFSQDHTQVIFTDPTQTIKLELAQQGMKQHQKHINHLAGKSSRYIKRYNDTEFLCVTANSQDKEISIRHSSDPKKKIKFYYRFSEGPVIIRDMLVYDNKIRIMVTRDDEEFIIYEWENFQEKEIFWQRFLESSNYIFEWPYICYLKGQKHIIIQNAFHPNIAFYIELQEVNDNCVISNLFLTDQYLLYVVIQDKNDYKIYEKDLDQCMPYIFSYQGGQVQNHRMRQPTKAQIVDNKKPIATISKAYLDYKSIYKFFVRSNSAKEIFQTHQERIIFFLCNFKIYSTIGSVTTIVDTAYKFRNINSNLIAYNTVDNRGRKSNEIKYLAIQDSEYEKIKVFEEDDGKLIDFLVQDGQLLVLIKQDKVDYHLLKVFDVNNQFQIKLKYQIQTRDERFIGSIQTINYFQANMIPAFNDLYSLVFNGEQTLIHYYENVIPILPHSGNQIAFYAPLLNNTYRKMIYFVTNKKFLKPKRGIILPYLIDNFTLLNKRTNIIQYFYFHEYQNRNTLKKETEILGFVPITKQLLHYNIKGQLIRLIKLNDFYDKFGDQMLDVSPNGKLILQKFQEELEQVNLFIAESQVISRNQSKEISQQLSGFQQKENKTLTETQETLSKELIPTPITQNIRQNSVESSEVGVVIKEHLKLDEIEIQDEIYRNINKFYLSQVIQYYQSQQCEVIYKINNNKDILIGFLYTTQTSQSKKPKAYLKELLLIKNQIKREVFKVRTESIDLSTKSNKMAGMINFNQDTIQQKLLKNYTNEGNQQLQDKEYTFFIAMKGLLDCNDFNITDDKLILWSQDKIFHGSLDSLNFNAHTITVTQCHFEIENTDESYISYITTKGQNSEDKDRGNYYIYIKLIVENSYSVHIKYNINKNKEFASFEAHIDSQVFFDTKFEGFILDYDSIIDFDQGIPLYFYQTGMNIYDKQYLVNGTIDRGARFCSKNNHFMIRNRFYLPYSYFTHILSESNKNKIISNETYVPDAFYKYEGITFLHTLANNYRGMEFVLNKYEASSPRLMNMVFLKDSNNDNVLQLSIKFGNTRCIKLILDKLSDVSMNNIHALRTNFVDLINYNGFEQYLSTCFFDTKQMRSKLIFSRKQDARGDQTFIQSHPTSFFDKEFYQKFQDPSQASKQVVIRALDAGWILKSPEGMSFQLALSESENMDYFAIDTVQLIVNFQWNIMKPLIITWLFIPFIFNMILFLFYAVYTFESSAAAEEKDSNSIQNLTVGVILLLYSFQTCFIEYKQIRFHKREYVKSFWNLLDMIAVLMVPLIVLLDFFNADPKKIRPLMAGTSLIFFMRFFYFLRIFDSSSHLIRTIIEITSDIRNFIFVFFLGIIGFGTSFYILSNNNDEEVEGAQFISSFFFSSVYAYRMSLGDFQLDAFEKSRDSLLIWSLFIICSLFTTIILLNMLVAIMGESFSRVNEQSSNQRVREHLQLIVENDFLIDREKTFAHVKFIIEIKDDVEEVDNDLISRKIQKIDDEIQIIKSERRLEMIEFKELLKSQSVQVQNIRSDITKLKTTLASNSMFAHMETDLGRNQTNNLDSFRSNRSGTIK